MEGHQEMICTCIDEGEPDFNGHGPECPRRRVLPYLQSGMLANDSPQMKDDPERAEAVLETIWRAIPTWAIISVHSAAFKEELFKLKPWLMDVFRAVRGERD